MVQTDSIPAADGQLATSVHGADLSLQDVHQNGKRRAIHAVYDRFTYIPPRCRYDPQKPFKFSMGLNVLFGKTDSRSSRL